MNVKAALSGLIVALSTVPFAAFAQTPTATNSFYAVVTEARDMEKNVRDIQDEIVRSQIQQRNLTADFFRGIPKEKPKTSVRAFEEFVARDPGLYPEKFATGYFGFYAAKALVTFRVQDRRRLEGIERPEVPAFIDLFPVDEYNTRLMSFAQKFTKSL